MSRLQKKCVLATAGIHLLLLVVLLVGPAFFTEKSRPDNTRTLDVIPANLVDSVLNSGSRNARPPAPAPEPKPVDLPPPTPSPPAPRPVATPPPTPAPAPKPEKRIERVEPVKRAVEPQPRPQPKVNLTRVEKPEEHHSHTPKVNLHRVTRDVSENPVNNSHSEADLRREQLAREARNAALSMKKDFSSAMEIEMPGDSSAAYANYASVVKSVYEQAWTPPNNVENDNANTKVKVTIGSDGSVISAHIIDPSGDSGVDASVQRTLDRVTFIAPFPDGSTDKERTYIINFNLKAKRMLG
jgi:TonB family protein